MTTLNKFSNSSSMIKMNNLTVRELRAIAKERGLHGFYKLLKTELVSLLDTPVRPPRRPGQKKAFGKVTLLPKPEDIDIFEQQEMQKNRSVVKTKLNEWYNWLADYVPKPIREPVSNAFSKVKNHIMGLYNGVKEKFVLKDEVEEQAKDELEAEEQVGEGDITLVEHEQAMNGSYKSFRIAGQNKTDVDSYVKRVKPHICKLIAEHLKVLDAAKIQMHMWVKWKKKEERAIRLDDNDKGGSYEVKVEKVFNSKMTEVFKGSNVEEILQGMFAMIKTQVEHPALPKSGFTLDYILHLDIDFHKLELVRGGLHIELPDWIAEKKAVINPKNTGEDCFKWAVIAALHHEDISNHPERITQLKPYVERYNWEGLEFPMDYKKISKFEKNNHGVAVNVLFVKEIESKNASKGGRVYVARRSDYNRRSKQVNLLMIVEGEKRHYTAVKNLSRLLSSENSKGRKGAYHYCVNCLNGFRTESARDKHYAYCSSHGEVRVKMPSQDGKWLKFYDGQCQFKVPFMMYADFESILKPIDNDYNELRGKYKEKMVKLNAKRKGKGQKVKESYTDKINTHVPSGWCVHSKFAYGEVPDPTKLYRGKDCVEEFVDHVEKEVKRLYELYPQKPMIELTEVLKREY